MWTLFQQLRAPTHVWLSLTMTVGLGCGGGGGGGDVSEPPPGGPDYYVSATGRTDNSPDSRDLPMANINAPIPAGPASGADIFVPGGTYTEGGNPVALRP